MSYSHRTMRRTLIFIAAGLLLLIVGAVLALPLLLDVNQYRGLIQAEAEKAIGRKVTLGEMSLSLLPFGISVSPIDVQDLVSAESVTVGARLMPLVFGGTIEVSKVVIESPEVTLARRADGTWSVSDLGGAQPAATDEADEEAPARTITLSKLKVTDGTVRLRDETRGTASIDVGLDLEASLSMTGDNAQAAASGRLTKGGSSLDVEGSIDKRGETIVVDVRVPSSEIHAADLNALLAAGATPLPFRFSTEDPVRLDAHVKGEIPEDMSTDALQIAVNVEVSRGTFEHPSLDQPIREIRGKLAYDGTRLALSGFHGVIGGSDVSGSLSIESFETPKAMFDLASKKADFMELMSFVRSETPAAAQAPAKGGAAAGTGDLLAAATARGTLSIGEGSFGALDFRDLESTLTLEKKVIRLDPVSMTLYDGRMTGTATMSMAASPPAVSVTAKADAIAVDPLLSDVLGMKGMLSGALTGDLAIAAAGDALDPILTSASGGGDIRIENGRVGALNVLGVLSKASGLLGEQSLKHLSNKLATEGTDFTSIAAGLKVAGGKISTRNLRLVSPDIDLTDDGTLDMLKGTLAIEGRIIFSDAISKAMVDEKSRAVDAFWDSSVARVSLPLKLEGPIDAPMPIIDWKTVRQSLARNKIEEALRKRGLGDILGGGTKAPEGSGASKAPDHGTLVERSGPGSGAAEPGAETGPLDVSIQRKEFSGNLLAPDLKIRGTLRGAKITEASLEVLDRDGRQVHETSLMKDVRDFYATAAAAETADIKFRVEVDGRKLVKAGRKLAFAIRLKDEAGHSVTRRWEVER